MARDAWRVVTAVFCAAWLANLAVLAISHEDGWMYPVTAFPMFSGQAPTAGAQYTVEARTGGRVVGEVPLDSAMDASHTLRPSLVDAVGRATVFAYQHGCPDARLRLDASCTGHAAAPANLRALWSVTVPQRLHLESAPDQLAFVVREVPVDGSAAIAHVMFVMPLQVQP